VDTTHVFRKMFRCLLGVVAAGLLFGAWAGSQAQTAHPAVKPPVRRAAKSVALATGMEITPEAARGAVFETLDPELPAHPAFRAGNAVTTSISPDGRTLLVLTSGFNKMSDANGNEDPAGGDEFVFVYDLAQGKPRKTQVLHAANTYFGLAWRPDGNGFYVSGGKDDSVHSFAREGERWKEELPAIALGHKNGLGIGKGTEPMIAGVAVNPAGTKLLAANFENDSVSLVDLKKREKVAELDLRPGKNDAAKRGVPGGEFPFAIAWTSEQTAFVTSQRDRELVELTFSDGLKIVRRIALPGQPGRLLADRAGTRLFVALHSSDQVAVVDVREGKILETIRTTAPETIFRNPKGWKGSNPNGLALSPDEALLFVSNGGANDVAVIALAKGSGGESAAPNQKKEKAEEHESAPEASRLLGLIPTGFYPTSVSVSGDGKTLYVSNSISPSGPNPHACRNTTVTTGRKGTICNSTNQYVLQLRHAGLLTMPLPAPRELDALTRQVARNNHWVESPAHRAARAKMEQLRAKVKHVIYILKENRTYDQMFGDLPLGNGDPRLTLFPEGLSPNHHRMARQFVTLDNFYTSGGVSGEGWNWATAGRLSDPSQNNVTVLYAGRGLNYDFEGSNRDINVSSATLEERRRQSPEISDDPDLLPGTADYSEVEQAGAANGPGYLWDAALRSGLSLRNYGFFLTERKDALPAPGSAEEERSQMPWTTNTVVAFPAKQSLLGVTDPYFHGFDERQSDFYLYQEWAREFEGYERDGNLPALTLLRLAHDHFGDFQTALSGVNTVETQMADNDYALGLVAERVARSRYKNDTIIFVTEDDAQDGPDHVDAQRSIALVLGAYVRRNALVSTRYTSVHLLRTMEDLLGIEPLGLFDAAVEPMADLFTTQPAAWRYSASVPEVLRSTRLPLPPLRPAGKSKAPAAAATPRHDAAWWAAAMRGLDFSSEDRLDTERFNRALWEGLKGAAVPYPEERDGHDLRENRADLLRRSGVSSSGSR